MSKLVLFCLVVVAAAGCNTNPQVKVSSGAFRSVDQIPTALVKGVSSEAEVEALLGAPNGKGEILLPPDHDRYKIWFYENIEVVSQSTSSQAETVVVEIGLRQQIMTIFFSDGKYQGYLWSSNSNDVTGYGRVDWGTK